MPGFGLMIEDLDAGAVRIALRPELDLAHAYTFDEELERVRGPAAIQRLFALSAVDEAFEMVDELPATLTATSGHPPG